MPCCRERSRQAQRRMGISRNPDPLSVVFENIQDMTVDELIAEFGVTREQVQAVLKFAALSAGAVTGSRVHLIEPQESLRHGGE
jgi:hypothetical protein